MSVINWGERVQLYMDQLGSNLGSYSEHRQQIRHSGFESDVSESMDTLGKNWIYTEAVNFICLIFIEVLFIYSAVLISTVQQNDSIIYIYIYTHIHFFLFFPFIFISWRLITLQYCSGFCHTLTGISHGFTCILHPDSPSHLPLHPIPLGLPSTPGPSTCLIHPAWAGDTCFDAILPLYSTENYIQYPIINH